MSTVEEIRKLQFFCEHLSVWLTPMACEAMRQRSREDDKRNRITEKTSAQCRRCQDWETFQKNNKRKSN